MNEMYKYLKGHAYISKNKQSNYQFELSEERAKCIANKYDSLTDELQQENKQLKEELDRYKWCNPKKVEIIQFENLQQKYDKQVDNWNKLKEDLKLVIDYGSGDEASRWDKIYGEHAKSTLKTMQELEVGDSND